jgi:hypothetical protein
MQATGNRARIRHVVPGADIGFALATTATVRSPDGSGMIV